MSDKNMRPADWEVLVESWDYDKAVKRTKPKVFRWATASLGLYRELYLAREALSRYGGDRKREGQDLRTWTDFCTDIGYTRHAINYRLKNFVPAELSASGTDEFLIDSKPSKEDRENSSLVRIQQFRASGVRPEGWIDDDESLLRRIDAEDKAVQIAHDTVPSIMRYKRQFRPSRDYFTEMLSRDQVREIDRFRIADRRLRSAQQVAGDSVARFLYAIDDLNERAKAAANLVVRLKDIINDSIEAAVRQSDDEDDHSCEADYEVMEEDD